jgi:universal stress protein A
MTPAITSILVPVDFSPCSDRAFRMAAGLAQKFDASLHLLHVVEFSTVMPAGWGLDYLPPNFDELRAEIVADAKRRLEGYRAQIQSAHVTVTTSVVMGHAPACIVDTASSGNADLLVMGTHGRRGFSHLLMGSVAERVIRTSPCPVLTVRDVGAAAGTATATNAA